MPAPPDEPGTAGRNERFIELDALRGIGAIAVVLFHFTTRFPQIFPQADHVPFAFWEGEYRVLLFFALSGFAIFFTLDRIGSVADFAINRFSRLFPAYWAAILLTLAFEYAAEVKALQIPASSVLANFTMLQGYLYLPNIDGAYWVLTIELGFYATMIALWLALGRGLARLEPVLLLWLSLKWLGAFWIAVPSRLSFLLALDYVPFFIIGMLCYRLWSGQRRWAQQLPYFVAALATLLATDGPRLFLAGSTVVVIFAAALGGALRPLCARPMLWFGAISYPLYLVHENIGFVIMLKAGEMGVDRWAGLAIALGTVTALAWVLHLSVELPASRAIGRWWKSRRVQIAPPSVELT